MTHLLKMKTGMKAIIMETLFVDDCHCTIGKILKCLELQQRTLYFEYKRNFYLFFSTIKLKSIMCIRQG